MSKCIILQLRCHRKTNASAYSPVANFRSFSPSFFLLFFLYEWKGKRNFPVGNRKPIYSGRTGTVPSDLAVLLQCLPSRPPYSLEITTAARPDYGIRGKDTIKAVPKRSRDAYRKRFSVGSVPPSRFAIALILFVYRISRKSS